MQQGDSSRRRLSGPRLRAALTLLGLGGLLIAYVAQAAISLANDPFRLVYQPFRSDGTMESVATGVAKRRMQTARLGVVLRSLGDIREVVAPENLDSLSNLPNELWRGRVTLALNPDVLANYAAGGWRQERYEPRLTDAQLESLKRGARITRRRGEIYVMNSDAEDGRWVLYADSQNRYIYVVPTSLAEEAGLR